MRIESYFTRSADVKSIILQYLDTAKIKVFVAVAWFTERELFNKLLELQDKGVQVELIITNHEFNDQSRNEYDLVSMNGGFFTTLGSDAKLMHMKFCVIDYNIAISGSANWTNKAFDINDEEVTIITGDSQRINKFSDEFERLKELSGFIKEHQEAIDISKVFKYFNLIKAFISIGDTNSIQPYIHELKNYNEIAHITDLMLNGKYDLAILEINNFERGYTQLVDITLIEKTQLISQINLFSSQIELLEIERIEIEAIIEQFNHRYIIELNPFISKILELKKKIYDKLKKHGVIDDKYEKIEEEFRINNKEYLKEIEIEIPNLNEEDTANIKKLYREAVKFCHPDSTDCIYTDKREAEIAFNELSKAYKENDLEKVKSIYNDIKLGETIGWSELKR